MTTSKLSAIVLMASMTLLSCNRNDIYDLGTIKVMADGEKVSLKSDLQFMTMAYRDLYGVDVPPDALDLMRVAYISFGDKALVIDEIVQALLLSSDLTLISNQDLRADIASFVQSSYATFLLREPSAFEQVYWVNQIQDKTDLTVRDIYYVFMTCEEYRYY